MQVSNSFVVSLPNIMLISNDNILTSRLVKPWWWREDAQEYLPILEKNEPTLKNWLVQVGLLQVCDLMPNVRERYIYCKPTSY